MQNISLNIQDKTRIIRNKSVTLQIEKQSKNMYQNYIKYNTKTDSKSTPSSTGKERDSETGFSYFGARYYDSDLMTGWLSVDPLADKYPNLSPYAYCAWNPIRLVDPDGRDCGDYYDDLGRYLGWDGKNDFNVHIVTDYLSKQRILKNSNSPTPTSNVSIAVSTNYFALKRTKEILDMTISDKGKNEYGTALQGNVSEKIVKGVENVLLPNTLGYSSEKKTSIHSHPYSENKNFADVISDDDKNTFKDYDLNIVVGKMYYNNEFGIVFYKPNKAEPVLSLDLSTLNNIINNQIKAMLEHLKF